ncbi:uncharacterized protein RHOBADRAFT_54381 [Rhodotorula graminis WP1]|uniref:Uncharacterized protein n=1 Tax=Rhodotorula graminis (strain WP1) TaxID=578459 RepID=A0A194S1V6_RHOGW|nr:uncharacterized protein RHOBADRAFT_54381 [Rhodotorula graminis WP1]KPV74582.1 hypothetical protein RHOBADRAFT_54381 [Rhodotorula graminis WP1]
MSENDKPTTRTSISSLLSRAQERVPPLSALPHLARQGAARVDPRQHAETLQLQLVIKSLSGCVQDRHALAREQQVFAKQLFTWSRDDDGLDVADTCDRLAWMLFKTSELEQECANKVEESRAILKDIRNMENDLVPRRRNEKQLANKIATLSKEAAAATTSKADLKASEQLHKLRAEHAQVEAENRTFEQSFAVLKRQKLHEAFSRQFMAQRALGDKSALVAAYGELLLQGLETQGAGNEYKGKERTARVKVELEAALAGWTPGPAPELNEQAHDDGASVLNHSDTRSFGETHGPQLSQLDSHGPPSSAPSSHDSPANAFAHAPALAHHHHISHPPPLATLHSQAELDTSSFSSSSSHHGVPPPLPPRASSPSPSSIPPPLPARASQPLSPGAASRINLSPTSPVLPTSPTRAATAVAVDLSPPGVDTSPGMAPPEPTVAETGAPILGTGGPSSGTLSPRRNSTLSGSGSGSTSSFATAHAHAHEPIPAGAAPQSAIPPLSMPGTFDAAGWGSSSSLDGQSGEHERNEDLPAYGEGDDEARRAREQAEKILAQERERKAGGGGGGFA